MAIAFDSVTENGQVDSPSSPTTYSHTCSGSDRFLLVGVTLRRSPSPAGTISSVTYNGAAMTLVGTPALIASNTQRVHLYYLENPDAGTNTISITHTAGQTNLWSLAASYTGVDQTPDIEDTGTQAGGVATSSSITMTSTSAGALMVGYFWADNNSSTSTDTLRNSTNTQANIVDLIKATAGSDTLNLSHTNSNRAAFGLTLAAAGGGGRTRRIFNIS